MASQEKECTPSAVTEAQLLRRVRLPETQVEQEAAYVSYRMGWECGALARGNPAEEKNPTAPNQAACDLGDLRGRKAYRADMDQFIQEKLRGDG
jgi:hypothetical protein